MSQSGSAGNESLEDRLSNPNIDKMAETVQTNFRLTFEFVVLEDLFVKFFFKTDLSLHAVVPINNELLGSSASSSRFSPLLSPCESV
ncbi:hypothetical protein TNCV_899861 [Trichonephila clavipes]|nr:hypothetical protein TNCV_899861 [Trichonephila clavipes]